MLSKTTSATNELAEEIQIKQKIDVEVALCRTKQSCELFCERGRSETSPESESEVDGNEVKSTTGTSVKKIQDSSRSQLTI